MPNLPTNQVSDLWNYLQKHYTPTVFKGGSVSLEYNMILFILHLYYKTYHH